MVESRLLEVAAIRMTSGSFPTQYEGWLKDGRHIYVRFRHGSLMIGVGSTLDSAVEDAMGEAFFLEENLPGVEMSYEELKRRTDSIISWPSQYLNVRGEYR